MKISNGFEAEIQEDRLDDWEILEAIDELEERPERAVKIAKLLLGPEDYKRLKECCKEDGKVSMSSMIKALEEILNSNGETKN